MASSQPEPAGVEACVHSLHERASRGDRDAQYAWAQILADCRFLSDENLGGKEAERLEVEPQATCSSSDGVAEALSSEHVRALCGQHGTPDGGYVHWLRKSASAGHPEAIRALFHHHPLADREGRVDPWQAVRYAEEVHQLEREARMWMLGLAHSGHVGALSDLAIAYAAGERLEADLARSLAYARSACSLRPVDCGVAPGQPGLAQLIAGLEADLSTEQLEQADRIEQAIRGRFPTGNRR
jgi:TPR repeat protein